MADILDSRKCTLQLRMSTASVFFDNNSKLKQRMVLIIFPQVLCPPVQGNLFLFLKATTKICVLSVCTVKKSKVVRSEMETNKFSSG